MHSTFRLKTLAWAGLVALVVGALAPSSAGAVPEPGAKGRGFRLFARSLGALTVNRIYCGLNSTGQVCVDSSGSSTIGGGYWPKGTADQYIFNSGLQLAGVIQGGPWDTDTTGAFFFDPKGTTVHGAEVRPIYNSQNADDLANWPAEARVPWRIQQVINRVRARAVEKGLPPELAEALWRQMIGWFIQYEEEKLSRQSEDDA